MSIKSVVTYSNISKVVFLHYINKIKLYNAQNGTSDISNRTHHSSIGCQKSVTMDMYSFGLGIAFSIISYFGLAQFRLCYHRNELS